MTQNKRSTPQDILQLLKNLEKRISRIEERLDIIPAKKNSLKKAEISLAADTDNIAESLEFNIGQYWFAKVGIFVLAIGIVFILTFPYRNLPPYVPSLIGYGLFSLIWAASFFLRKSFAHVAGYLLTGNFLLLYFSTLRLYYFGDLPVFNNKLLILSLLIFVVILIIYLSLRQKSVLNCGIGFTLMYVTTLTADSALTIFIMISVTALFAAYILLKYQWYNIFIYSIVLTYFFHFIWFINNPFLGNRIQFVSQPEYNIWFVLIYTTVFALALLFRPNREKEDGAYITATFLNSGGGYGLLLILTLTKFSQSLGSIHFIISLLFLGLAILFWIREQSRYATFFYAIIGYTALSVAIIAQSVKPDFFVWLTWQSLIVISTAIWFRSKFIIFANFTIYIFLFLAYLIIATEIGGISLSFGFVALVSARLLNWQKNRLELKTEFMRNAYLTCAFFIFPLALFNMMPPEYVPLSWIAVTLLYYTLSVTLKNVKYRWMALYTLLLTVLYVLIIGIIQLEPVYRIISFTVLGLVLVVASLFYTMMYSKKGKN